MPGTHCTQTGAPPHPEDVRPEQRSVRRVGRPGAVEPREAGSAWVLREPPCSLPRVGRPPHTQGHNRKGGPASQDHRRHGTAQRPTPRERPQADKHGNRVSTPSYETPRKPLTDGLEEQHEPDTPVPRSEKAGCTRG